jgi:hypothetical protein
MVSKTQLEYVKDCMMDGQWRTLEEIASYITTNNSKSLHKPLSIPGISARLRDLRKVEHGAHDVEKRVREGCDKYTWEYKLVINGDL